MMLLFFLLLLLCYCFLLSYFFEVNSKINSLSSKAFMDFLDGLARASKVVVVGSLGGSSLMSSSKT